MGFNSAFKGLINLYQAYVSFSLRTGSVCILIDHTVNAVKGNDRNLLFEHTKPTNPLCWRTAELFVTACTTCHYRRAANGSTACLFKDAAPDLGLRGANP